MSNEHRVNNIRLWIEVNQITNDNGTSYIQKQAYQSHDFDGNLGSAATLAVGKTEETEDLERFKF